MQETDPTYEQPVDADAPRPARGRRRPLRRLLVVATFLLALTLIAVILPLLNLSRYQRRIVASLSESLGRPIHLDRISLTVFPLPGLTIENLVVAEDPAFGSEPFVRASAVRATLRISSLWRRRIEFTRIAFTSPSINLVKTPQGKWNLESILVQAARIEAAPTAQSRPGAAPRFPYIEATDARLNLKLGGAEAQEKTPISLTEAELALWLNNPQQWRLRLEGHPVRTDTVVSDTGTLRMEGTLGRAPSLGEVPIDLKAEWRDVPLGEASRIVLARDAGLRGSISLVATTRGTLGRSAVQTTIHIADLRRADFLPLHPITVDIECQAGQTDTFRSFTDLRCVWPPPAAPPQIALTGSIPEVSDPMAASFALGSPGLPAATMLDWLRVASNRIGPDVAATGSVVGSLSHRASGPENQIPADQIAQSQTLLDPSAWTGQVTLTAASISIPSVTDGPIFQGSLTLRTLPSQPGAFLLAPVALNLGDHNFATLDGRFDAKSYTLHLTGTAIPARLLALGAALPQLGSGLAEVLPTTTAAARFDLTASQPWGSPQTWVSNVRQPPKLLHRR